MGTICVDLFLNTRNSQYNCQPKHTQSLSVVGECNDNDKDRSQTNQRTGLTVFAAATLAFRPLLNWYRLKQQQRINRDAYKHMLALSDELLDDIGVTREDVRWAAQLPLSVDAACALREVSKGTSGACHR